MRWRGYNYQRKDTGSPVGNASKGGETTGLENLGY